MSNIKKSKRKVLYKKLLRLRTNPLNNTTFIKLNFNIKQVVRNLRDKKTNKYFSKIIYRKIFFETQKLKKKKWDLFSQSLIKKQKFFVKYKPKTFKCYNSSKFASLGNSFKKRFRNSLFAKKTFNYFYSGLLRKYLKKKIIKIYNYKKPRNPRELAIEFFESRLDSVIYRSKFSYTAKNARQLISHGHVTVNNKTETNNSYILKQGDSIKIKRKSLYIIKINLNRQFKERFDKVIWPVLPSYLNVNYRTLEIIFDNIKKFDFSPTSNFKMDVDASLESYYRH